MTRSVRVDHEGTPARENFDIDLHRRLQSWDQQSRKVRDWISKSLPTGNVQVNFWIGVGRQRRHLHNCRQSL